MRILAFDIETAAAEELHSYGPGFVRLCGWADALDPDAEVHISADPAELLAALSAADAITGCNILNFDLLALAKHNGADYEALARKSYDTIIVERHVNPIAAKGMQPRGYYGLDATAARYGAPGKTDDLKALARKWGGFDKIPQDDPTYRLYLTGDVRASAGLFRVMRKITDDLPAGDQRYIRREHYVSASMGRVTLEGFRTDVDETMRRWVAGQKRLEDGKQLLHERFGMPLEGKKPHTTNPGKAAFRKAILATGISEEALDANWPTNKDGSLSTAKDVLNGFIPVFERTKPAAAELCRTVLAMNGERTIYGTVLDHLVGDHVHPYIGPDQSSGRWSMKDPGLTVFGKRGGKAVERAIMLADSDDEVLVAIDADQVDARVIAAECQDPAYMALFGPGMDLHSEVAFRVWPSPAQHGPDCHQGAAHDCGFATKCHCELRDRAKVSGHGFSYGLGAAGMARQQGIDISVSQGFIRGMTEAFPRLAEWKEEIRAAAGVLGFGEEAPSNDTYRILHTWAGRPIRVERNRAYTQATAQVGQGGTRDVMAEAILRLPPKYRRRIRAVIHDELVLSLPKRGAQETAQSIADGMAFDLKGVQITFGCSTVGPNWASCYGY